MLSRRAMSTNWTITNKVRNGIRAKSQPDYNTCIQLLNSLQSNANYIKTANINHNPSQLKQVENFLARSGISLDKLDELSVIHVAGTKGKGTTCALTESILRHHGYKTGFFSSPHLLEVRERIRIDGKPIGCSEFSEYFWRIFQQLEQTKKHDNDMPLYFRFLTIMAFMVFLEKHVDVAIIEVGIGGEYDCTNILRKVPVVGITSLGIDHTTLLGDNIESIAWHKAGIIKQGCLAFTVPQPESAMAVLQERSQEKNSKLEIVENRIKFNRNTVFPTNILNLNANLAVALSKAWLSLNPDENHQLSDEITEIAVTNCVWPGRFQVKHSGNITFYLDGAHTSESIEICSKWYADLTKTTTKLRVLMFNITGNRNAENLLKSLRATCSFDGVIFVTNTARTSGITDNISVTTDNQLEKCQQHKQLWLKFEQHDRGNKAEFIEIFPTVNEAVEFVKSQTTVDLLVTGSLHLIGAVLNIIEPDLNNF